MTCCILEKRINTTYIPGNPGQAGFPGQPAKPAYCATNYVQSCQWVPNPAITYRNDCVLTWGWWANSQDATSLQCEWEANTLGRISQNCAYRVTYGQKNVCTLNMYHNGQLVGPVWFGNTYGITTYMGVPLYVYSCQSFPVTTCYPATAAIPPIPYIAPTPAQIITDYNLGWNSHSRAIDSLDVGRVFTFTVANGVHGAFVALGPSGVGGQNLASFGWGLMIDTTGVKVFEHGVHVATLGAGYNSTTAFSMEREFDGRLIYRADLDEYTSANPPAVSDVLYPYTYLYSGGDRLLCASYADLNPEQTASSTMTGKGTLLVGAPSVDGTFNAAITMTGLGLLNVDEPYPYAITMSGKGALSAGVNTMQASITLPALDVLGADFAYSFVDTQLPAIELASSMAMYVPPQPTTMYGTLPFLQAYGFIQTVEIDNGDMTLPEMQVVGGDYDYAFFNQSLPPLLAAGYEGTRLEMTMLSHLVAFDPMTAARDLVIVFTSTGQLASVQSVSVLVLAEFMSTLLADDSYTLLGEFNLSMLSTLRGASYQTHHGALNNLGRVWVVNVDTAAAWRYQGYGFNSFFKRGEQYYGVAEDGVYLLEGGDDAGADIDARLDTGRSNFGESKTKTVPSVYLAVASEDVMVLRVEADGQEYFYEARSSSAELKNHRVDVGRGLEGAHWSFSVLNKDGADFDLASMEFAPILNKRRI